MTKVCLQYDKKTQNYPGKEYSFSPSSMYPEYMWHDEISDEENCVYDLVRECFITAKLDTENLGNDNWNPLGVYINEGDTVLLKPNWVENKNKNIDIHDNLACLVTNPSVVRAVIDYVVIALKGSGRIIIADAPMQGCDLDDLFRITGYNALFEFYREKNIEIEVYDLRKYSVERKYRGVFLPPKETNNGLQSVNINLGKKSMHAEKDDIIPKYKVEDYEQVQTAKYHSEGNHIYEINELPLKANVIINLPKPKTHRLAGMTGACKNLVGITYEKASLPHRIDGDKSKEMGDAYLKHSIWKDGMRFFNEKRTHYSRKGAVYISKFYDLLMKTCFAMGAITTGDKYRVGSWYGNDTIWRTVVDLNNIMIHCDKDGNYHDEPQRKIIAIGDMIIGGQKEGPVGPTPKKLGIILFADNNLIFDRMVCGIMGFESTVFKSFYDTKALKAYHVNTNEVETTCVFSNVDEIDGKKICDAVIPKVWNFEPHSCWKGHIEKK